MIVRGEKLFLNMYIMLVGPPASGKTRAIRAAQQMVEHSKSKLFPQQRSREKVIEKLCGSLSTFEHEGLRTQCALSGFFDEIVNFIGRRDYDFLATLTDWYDCPRKWTYSTRQHGDEQAENIYVNFIGGITSRTISDALGNSAFGMGFTSRLNLIFSEDYVESDPFTVSEIPDMSDLEKQILDMQSMTGQFSVPEPSKALIRAWIAEGMKPLPMDSRFAEYNPRRWLHWLKLSMIFALSMGRLTVTTSDLELGRHFLLEAEEVMPLALEFMGSNPMAEAVQQLHRWAMIEWLTGGRKPIHESRILRKLLADVPQQYHGPTIEYMLASKMFSCSGSAPNRQFTPLKTERT